MLKFIFKHILIGITTACFCECSFAVNGLVIREVVQISVLLNAHGHVFIQKAVICENLSSSKLATHRRTSSDRGEPELVERKLSCVFHRNEVCSPEMLILTEPKTFELRIMLLVTTLRFLRFWSVALV